MAVNKVVYVENGVQKTLVDLSADTVSAETLKKGATAHDKTGAKITGAMEASTSEVKVQSKTVTPTFGTQTITPDTGYDGLSQVTVKSIPHRVERNSTGYELVIGG